MVSLVWSQGRNARAWVCAGVLLTMLTACTDANSTPPTPAVRTTSTASPLPVFGDRGPRAYAHGKARLLSSGDYLYTVASGDTAEGIARRFGSTADRVSGGSRGGLEIFAGDQLRFGPAPGAPQSMTASTR